MDTPPASATPFTADTQQSCHSFTLTKNERRYQEGWESGLKILASEATASQQVLTCRSCLPGKIPIAHISEGDAVLIAAGEITSSLAFPPVLLLL